VRVLAGQEGRTRRATEGERDEVVVESHTLVADETPDVREHLHLGERLVVGLEDDDVGPLRRLCSRGLGGAAVLLRTDRDSRDQCK
jgi:hypothetical protein